MNTGLKHYADMIIAAANGGTPSTATWYDDILPAAKRLAEDYLSRLKFEQYIPDGYHVIEDLDGERYVKNGAFPE